jgi:hypothetical protein
MQKNQGTAIKVSNTGKVRRSKQDVQMTFRASGELVDRFQACAVMDAAMHGNDVNFNATMRQLLTAYCNRVEATAASPEARDAAKVLRKKVA